MPKPFNVLFLRTGNSARSILAEAILNYQGADRFRAFSAGSYPKGAVHPLSLELLRSRGFPVDALHSKSWNDYSSRDAPKIDLVITVCDQAAGETCPIWPGHPVTVHWGLPDPVAIEGTLDERRSAFRDAFQRLERVIRMLVSLPVETMDRATPRRRAQEIGPLQTELTGNAP
jgi:arsenate reductase (thioredoxin)